MSGPVVEVSGLRKVFRSGAWLAGGRSEVTALDGVEFRLAEGEFAALVGESGSGKTTLGRILLGLLPFEAGSVRVLGWDVAHLRRKDRKQFRRSAQIVFQNPYASLNPALRVRSMLSEAVRVHRDLGGADLEREVQRLAGLVHLPLERLHERPGSLSGGERRRVAFGRALATRPRFVVTDEPVAGLDSPIQVQLLDLLRRIHRRRKITFLLISHDMRAVRSLATRVIVLYRGRIVENAPASTFFARGPAHPYSAALLQSAFEAPACLGDRQSVVQHPSDARGCPYRNRCEQADVEPQAPCATIAPPLEQGGPDHWVACHKWRRS